MNKLILHPTETSQWYALINEAEALRNASLSEDLESYLVFLLMRFISNTELASSVLAMDFFHSQRHVGEYRKQLLRELGDKCLLFSGLFPGRAVRKRVEINYFVSMGQSAYGSVSIIEEPTTRSLFSALAQEFVSMMDVLQATRYVCDVENPLYQMQTCELLRESDERLPILKKNPKSIRH